LNERGSGEWGVGSGENGKKKEELIYDK